MITDQIAPVFGHHAAMPLIIFPTPIKVVEVKGECPIALRQRLKNFDAGIHNFGADTVAWDCRNVVGLHERYPSSSV